MTIRDRHHMPVLRWALLLILCTLMLISCTSQAEELPHATGDFATVTDIAPSVVKLGILDNLYLYSGSCTGSIVDARGIILTNYHCVADQQTKEFLNPDKMLEVYITSSYGSPPEFKYYAQVVATKADADLAVLQIVRMKTGATPIECLNLPAMTIRAGSPAIEDEVRAVGYPGFGGSTLTVTDGKIAGLVKFGNGDPTINGPHKAIKITAIIGHGNSGGALVNNKNELIGVTTFGVPDNMGSPGQMNYAVALSEATSIIDDALLNPKPGCEDAPPVSLQRDIKAYPSVYVDGSVTYYPKFGTPSRIPYMTLYFFAPEIDVDNMTLEDIDGAIARIKSDENGNFKAVLTREQFAMQLGIVLVKKDQNSDEERVLIRQNAGDASQLSLNRNKSQRTFEFLDGTVVIISELQSVQN